MDRKPLSQVEDKSPETEPLVESTEIPSDGKGINEMMDMRVMATMFGYEMGFETDLGKAESIYNWAKQSTGLPGGPEVLERVKLAISFSGIRSQGRELVAKLYEWTKLDSNIQRLRKEQQLYSE